MHAIKAAPGSSASAKPTLQQEQERHFFLSEAMREVCARAFLVADTDVTVLLTGPSGSGKEVIADLIHRQSDRASQPFVKLNCAAVPRELFESELFGSVKGSYTGSRTDTEGLFRQANRGTLMLDELAEMPAEMQCKLLRVLQDQVIRPVGGRDTFKVDVRIVAATNQEPLEAMRSGRLRPDLYYRVARVVLVLPPLAERREEVVPLAEHFLATESSRLRRPTPELTGEARERLWAKEEWPGNVRELQGTMLRALLFCQGNKITGEDVDPVAKEGASRERLLALLHAHRGNLSAAAKAMGTYRNQVLRRCRELGIDVEAIKQPPGSGSTP